MIMDIMSYSGSSGSSSERSRNSRVYIVNNYFSFELLLSKCYELNIYLELPSFYMASRSLSIVTAGMHHLRFRQMLLTGLQSLPV